MLRLIWPALACAFIVGCNRAAPPAPPPADTASTAPSPAVAPSTPAPSTATSPVTSNSPPSASPLSDLAARYLDSDGQGGWRTNEKAATELEKLAPEEMARLWTLLNDPTVEVRRGAAVFLLTQFNAANSEQVASFSALLDDSDRMVRARALDAVRQFAGADKIAALPRLTAMLDPAHEDRAENRAAVARICGSLKAEAATALAALELASTNDPDSRVRAAAIAAIAQIATADHLVAPLSKALSDADASVRIAAAARLRQLGRSAAPAAKALAAALADSNADVAEAAAEALIRIGAPAVDPLAGQLGSGSNSARRLALACLVKLGPVAKSAAASIEKCARDPDPQVRQLAETALKNLASK